MQATLGGKNRNGVRVKKNRTRLDEDDVNRRRLRHGWNAQVAVRIPALFAGN